MSGSGETPLPSPEAQAKKDMAKMDSMLKGISERVQICIRENAKIEPAEPLFAQMRARVDRIDQLGKNMNKALEAIKMVGESSLRGKRARTTPDVTGTSTTRSPPAHPLPSENAAPAAKESERGVEDYQTSETNNVPVPMFRFMAGRSAPQTKLRERSSGSMHVPQITGQKRRSLTILLRREKKCCVKGIRIPLKKKRMPDIYSRPIPKRRRRSYEDEAVKLALENMPTFPSLDKTTRPHGLVNFENYCASNAAIQALAAAMDPEWLMETLGDAHIGSHKTKVPPPRLDTEEDYHNIKVWASRVSKTDMSLSRILLETLNELRQGTSPPRHYIFQQLVQKFVSEVDTGPTGCYTNTFQALLATLAYGKHVGPYDSRPKDHLKLVHPIIPALFKIEHQFSIECAGCKRLDVVNKEFDWFLRIGPHKMLQDYPDSLDVPKKSRSPEIGNEEFTLESILEGLAKPKTKETICGCCSHQTATVTWQDLSKTPEVLIFDFDRAVEHQGKTIIHKYHVELPDRFDFSPFDHDDSHRTLASKEPTIYELVSTIQGYGKGDSAHAFALLNAGGGQWVKADDHIVTDIEDRKAECRKTSTCQAIYKRVRAP